MILHTPLHPPSLPIQSVICLLIRFVASRPNPIVKSVRGTARTQALDEDSEEANHYGLTTQAEGIIAKLTTRIQQIKADKISKYRGRTVSTTLASDSALSTDVIRRICRLMIYLQTRNRHARGNMVQSQNVCRIWQSHTMSYRGSGFSFLLPETLTGCGKESQRLPFEPEGALKDHVRSAKVLPYTPHVEGQKVRLV